METVKRANEPEKNTKGLFKKKNTKDSTNYTFVWNQSFYTCGRRTDI